MLITSINFDFLVIIALRVSSVWDFFLEPCQHGGRVASKTFKLLQNVFGCHQNFYETFSPNLPFCFHTPHNFCFSRKLHYHLAQKYVQFFICYIQGLYLTLLVDEKSAWSFKFGSFMRWAVDSECIVTVPFFFTNVLFISKNNFISRMRLCTSQFYWANEP
jgi:hypothetical protein